MKCFHKACSATWAARLRISLISASVFVENKCYGVLDTVRHFGIVIVRTVQHLYSIVDTVLVLQAVHPKSEAGKIGRNGGHAESHALQRGISPRLIVRGINAEVLSRVSGRNNAC